MKRAVTALVSILALTACNPPSEYSAEGAQERLNYAFSKREVLKGCKVEVLEDKYLGKIIITVCPLSVTSTQSQSGKTTNRTTTVHGGTV